MSDASSRPAAVSFALCYCFPFLEVPDVVHRAGLVCQLWQKYARSDALWERLVLRDTPPVVYAALEEVVANPLVDPVLAASAGVAAMLQQSVEERWDAVKWQMLHPLRHHGFHATLADAALEPSQRRGHCTEEPSILSRRSSVCLPCRWWSSWRI